MIPEKPSGPHPEAETLRRAFHAPSDPASADVLGHAAVCATCSAELAAIEAFDSRPADLLGMEARRARAAWARFSGAAAPRRSSLGLVPALAMAAVVCLAALAFFVPRREADVLRGGENARGEVSPDGEIPTPPAEFRFPQGRAPRVRVSVFDADRRYVWTSPPFPAGVAVPFPPEERAKLRPGVAYSWVVLGESSPSPPRTFEIRPAQER